MLVGPRCAVLARETHVVLPQCDVAEVVAPEVACFIIQHWINPLVTMAEVDAPEGGAKRRLGAPLGPGEPARPDTCKRKQGGRDEEPQRGRQDAPVSASDANL